MSTSASTQTVLTIVKDEFAEVLTEGTLSPTTKPADWNVIITEKALLETAKTSVCKSGLVTGKRPGPDRTRTC
jgi:hypothetical protein